MKTENPTTNSDTAQVTIETSLKGLQTKVKAGVHSFIMDEPADMGGQNTGPRPQDLILAALGSCTAITLRMYADRKAFPLEKVDVKLDFEEEAAEAVSDKPKKIKMQVSLHGNLTEEQVARLKVIAGKCPVHKSLSPAFPITTEVELAGPEFQ